MITLNLFLTLKQVEGSRWLQLCAWSSVLPPGLGRWIMTGAMLSLVLCDYRCRSHQQRGRAREHVWREGLLPEAKPFPPRGAWWVPSLPTGHVHPSSIPTQVPPVLPGVLVICRGLHTQITQHLKQVLENRNWRVAWPPGLFMCMKQVSYSVQVCCNNRLRSVSGSYGWILCLKHLGTV